MPVTIKKSKKDNVVKLPNASNPIHQAALEYHKKGFHILPLDHDNICHWKDEQQKAYVFDPKDFAGKGVGVHLEKSGLAGLDIDCPEVVPFLEAFLSTTATTCRESKECSWMFFKLVEAIGEAKNISFKDCDNEGKQNKELGGIKFKVVTALPPTTHAKTGEILKWVESKGLDALATISTKKLIEITSRCYALAYIAQLWPEAGNRHDAGLALAGALAHAKWSLEDAKKAVKALAKATNDSKVEDRLNELKSSYEAHEADKEVTGLPKLAELLTLSLQEQDYLKKYLYAWLRGNPEPDKEKGDAFDLTQYVFSATKFLAQPIPPIEYIIHGLFPVAGLVNVHAFRGVGKSWLCIEMAISVAKGKDFLDWPVPKARRVLYIDGEMSPAMLQERVKKLCKGSIPENLSILSLAYLRKEKRTLNLHQPENQQQVTKCLEKYKEQGNQSDLIILDNVSSLCQGIDDNSNSAQDSFLNWLLELRSLGYSVLIVDHSGKDNEKGTRGASRKEDILDTAICLKAKDDSDGAHFEVCITKTRGEKPNPPKLSVRLITDEDGTLKWDTGISQQEQPLYVKCLIAIHQHKPSTLKELAGLMNCVPSNLTDPIKIASDKGLLTKKPLELTPSGKVSIQPIIEEMDVIGANM